MPVQVVRDARAGDRGALDVLAGAYLPLVYNVVRRSAEPDLDVDDIVQETMMRVIGGIGAVREEERLRAWVVTIALRQLTEARQQAGRERARREREIPDRGDPTIDVERSVALRLVLTGEQQELERAAAWLEPDYREALTLWWLEARGDLGRAEAAAAFGESVAHFGVRVQRMRQRLDIARAIVRVLEAEPRCTRLSEVVAAWNGKPTPLWRKRIAAHVRDCAECGGRSTRLPNPEWMLASAPFLAPPPHLTAAVSTLPKTAALTGKTAALTGKTAALTGKTAALTGKTAAAGSVAPGHAAGVFGLGAAKVLATAAAVTVLAGGVAAVIVTRQDTGTRKPRTTAAVVPAPVPSITTTPAAKPSATTRRAPGAAGSTFRTTVPALPKTLSIADIGAIHQNSRVAGRDDGQSTAYGSTSVWIFDDTTLKNPFGFLSNSAAVTADTDASNGLDLRSGNGATVDDSQTPVELIGKNAAEKAYEEAHPGEVFGFWPGPVIADSVRHRVLFTYGKLCRGGKGGAVCSGPLGKGLGTGIAALDMRTGKVSRLIAGHAPAVTSVEGHDPAIFFGPGKTNFGGAAALVVDGQAYLYGGCTYAGCRLARVALGSIADLARWRYYAGGKWVSDAAQATRVGVQPGGAGQTVFYSAGMKAYVNVFMPYGTTDVKYQVGGSPFGPWSRSVKLMSAPAGSYALFGHSEFAERGGLTQYLSYFDPKTGEQRLIRWRAAG
jgi:RNA polymerase sigma factor (sigma-70 family)